MKHADFQLGMLFWCTERPHRPWRVTDIGTRVVVALQIDYIFNPETGAYDIPDPFYDEYRTHHLLECVFHETELEHCMLANSHVPPFDIRALPGFAAPVTAEDADAVAMVTQGDLF